MLGLRRTAFRWSRHEENGLGKGGLGGLANVPSSFYRSEGLSAMATRQQRAAIAAETIEVLGRGTYAVDGHSVSIADRLAESCRNTRIWTPDELERLIASPRSASGASTTISFDNCTTLGAARQLLEDGFPDPLLLNFASAKNPGGGFLFGSQAQEECLARASGLYASLCMHMPFYDMNRRCKTSLYTNHAIYSPGVPVFRDDADALLHSPYLVSMVTSPAVNAGAVRKNEPQHIGKIEATMRHRIDSILAIAHRYRHRALVLGAWGCGVFGNDPAAVANWFREALTSRSQFASVFDRVVFAVLDLADGTPTFNAFRQTFAE
jgi:uncharacterized protein (TIGR02452 family)